MTHKASAKFWQLHNALPVDIQELAAKAFGLLKSDPRHPSLHFKRLSGSNYWSVRINDDFRAVAVNSGEIWAWFWIGPHDEYNRLIKAK